MLLDQFVLHSFVLQITYPEQYEIWDHAGTAARQLHEIWPGLALSESQPNEQALQGPGVKVTHSLTSGVVVLWGEKGFDAPTVERLVRTLNVWRTTFQLQTATRVSCRSKFVRDYGRRGEASAQLLSWGLCRMPTSKVFGQSQESEQNGVELLFRFEDETSFAVVRTGVESLTLQLKAEGPEAHEFPSANEKKEKHRLFIDFDRGVLGKIGLQDFNLAEWIKGYQHLLRRDIEKVLQPGGAQ